MLKMHHLYKTYTAEQHVLRNLSVQLEKPGFYYLSGASGSGKTTLFKILIAQEKPTSGEVTFNDLNLSNLDVNQVALYRRRLGIIFQDGKLLAELSAQDNILLPMKILKKPSPLAKKKLEELSEILGIQEFLNEFPEHLSGGQQQRIAVARALIHEPEFIIADEPTGNLDKKNALAVLYALQNTGLKNKTVLFATHDEQLIQVNPSPVLLLENGQIQRISSLQKSEFSLP